MYHVHNILILWILLIDLCAKKRCEKTHKARNIIWAYFITVAQIPNAKRQRLTKVSQLMMTTVANYNMQQML